MEDHEVGDEDLVHPADRLEGVEVVAGRLGGEVADSEASSALSGWIRSPRCLEHGRDRVLRQPVDLEVGMQLAQLVGDGDVALGVAEADGGRDVQRAPAARQRPGPRAVAAAAGLAGRSRGCSRLTLTGSRAWGRWPAPSRIASSAFASFASRAPDSHGRMASSFPWITSDRAVDPRQTGRGRRRSSWSRGASWVGDQRLRVRRRGPSRPCPRICFVECGSVKHCAKKNSRNLVVAPPSSDG